MRPRQRGLTAVHWAPCSSRASQSSTVRSVHVRIAVAECAGRRRSPATLPGYLAGRPPRNEGLRYPPDPPSVEEIVAVMRQAGDGVHGARLRALIVLLWRAGLRINEALALTEHDLDARRGAILVRHGKGGKRREIGMDDWGWQQLAPWLQRRLELPVGPLLGDDHRQLGWGGTYARSASGNHFSTRWTRCASLGWSLRNSGGSLPFEATSMRFQKRTAWPGS
jgi:integrase